MDRSPIALPYNDYVQSANTLFNFMEKFSYLKDILKYSAIIPRYCVEDIEYLKIKTEEGDFGKIAVLQKCFCDIPFHKLTDSFKIQGSGENFDQLSEIEKIKFSQPISHPDFYGKFGIAFSKKWGEVHNLQPVHYINEGSEYLQKFSAMLNQSLNADDLSDLNADDLMRRLSYLKPLRGSMHRWFKQENGENIDIEVTKNFHDEREWRYIPKSEDLEALKLEAVIANPFVYGSAQQLRDINSGLTQEKYRPIWLPFSYDEIRYIIVPDDQNRLDIIDTIMSIPSERFANPENVMRQRYVLISKILVLEEMRKDW